MGRLPVNPHDDFARGQVARGLGFTFQVRVQVVGAAFVACAVMVTRARTLVLHLGVTWTRVLVTPAGVGVCTWRIAQTFFAFFLIAFPLTKHEADTAVTVPFVVAVRVNKAFFLTTSFFLADRADTVMVVGSGVVSKM